VDSHSSGMLVTKHLKQCYHLRGALLPHHFTLTY